MNHMNLNLIQELQDLHEDMSTRMPALDREISSPEQFDQTIEEISRRFEAARRALGLVNKLSDGPTKKRHAARVMANMNIIRNYMNLLMRQLDEMSKE